MQNKHKIIHFKNFKNYLALKLTTRVKFASNRNTENITSPILTLQQENVEDVLIKRKFVIQSQKPFKYCVQFNPSTQLLL